MNERLVAAWAISCLSFFSYDLSVSMALSNWRERMKNNALAISISVHHIELS